MSTVNTVPTHQQQQQQQQQHVNSSNISNHSTIQNSVSMQQMQPHSLQTTIAGGGGAITQNPMIPSHSLQVIHTNQNNIQPQQSQLQQSQTQQNLNSSQTSSNLANSNNNNNSNNNSNNNASSGASASGQMSGYLSKWTNYLKGYQRRWFNLNNGLLSYYRSPTEMTHTCRGTINLANASISSEDSLHFVVSNGGAQVFHLKASSEQEKQKWVSALEMAKNRAKQDNPDSDEETNPEQEKNEVQTMLKTLQTKLEDLNTCHDLVQKHSGALTKSLMDLENIQSRPDENLIKTINERATLFKITLLAMINACQEFNTLANAQGKKMQKVLQSERDMRIKLEDMIQEMAKAQSNIESQISKRSKRTPTLTTPDTNVSRTNSTKIGQMQLTNVASATASGGGGGGVGVQQATSGISNLNVNDSPKHAQNAKFELDNDDDDSSYRNNNDDEFHDALEEVTEFPITITTKSKSLHRRNASNLSKLTCEESEASTDDEQPTIKVTMHKQQEQQHHHQTQQQQQQQQQQQLQLQTRPTQQLKVRERRKEIPPRPNYSLNLWGIMKNCIGKDLSKIPIPVNFSEPISMLQRLVEELEYSELLDKAANCDDQWEQMAYVAAFTISAYSTTATRTNKPFNPILGETYECDRIDESYGWRALSEQVSHHPPGFSVHVESARDWILYQEFLMSSKFRGQYLQVIPLGTSHLEFKKSGHHYTWRKINTFVRNIIVGKLWIDNVGEMDIINHKTKDVCHLKYFAYSYFSREPPRKVTGIITDSNNVARYVLNGTWTEQIEGAPVLNPQVLTEQTQLNTGTSKILWKRKYPPAYLESMYNFTELAVQLNEPEDGVAPTDSRYRPDQRLMEDGKWDDANKEKIRLEDKQRTTRKQREQVNEQLKFEGKSEIEYQPLWFKRTMDPYTKEPIHVFKNEYWECKKKQDWSRCPDLF